jgi:hypothetical protein
MEGGFESSGGGASVYSEAKSEYTKQLTQFVVPAFHRFFMGSLQQAATEEPQLKRQLWKFQEILSQVPEWNMDKVQREIQRLVTEINCDYLEELVTAVFIAHTKILTAIRIGNKNKRVQITIPKLEHFLHRSLSECSRLLWSSAYLFNTELSPVEKQKNHRQIEQLLHDGIAQAIRGLLPVKNILKDYLAEPEDEADDEADDEDEHEQETITPVAVPASTSAPGDSTDTIAAEQVVDQSVHESEQVHIEPTVALVPLEETHDVQIPTEAVTPVPVPEIPAAPLTTPVPTEVPTPAPTPVMPTIPTFVVDTEPAVRFTSHNQVIQQRGNETQIEYVETDHIPRDEMDAFTFTDDDAESLSDYENLDEDGEEESLSDEDFETLG